MKKETKRAGMQMSTFLTVLSLVWGGLFYVEFFVPSFGIDGGMKLILYSFLILWWPFAVWSFSKRFLFGKRKMITLMMAVKRNELGQSARDIDYVKL